MIKKIMLTQLVPCLLLFVIADYGFFARIRAAQQQIISPEKFFGFSLGSDKQIARWDKLVEYYRTLEKQSAGKLKVIDMGPTTMGNPFLLVIISSAANISNLDRLREVNAVISDPRKITELEIAKLIKEGKAIICQSMSLHASEIGGTQMAPELTYDLVTRQDEETQRILDNVIFLMVPSFNPDGAIMIADWYRDTLGTEYEGGSLPWLYHKYAGHDNNRDAFQTNLVESQYMAKILFTGWVPQAFLDHHHMGSYGARIYVPPYAEPVRPFADPLVWREQSWYGAHIAYKEEEAGMSGTLNMAQYSGWGHFGFHWITPFHNITGMLTESANAKLATPIYIHPEQLRGGARGLPAYEEQTTFPNPWLGGWWRLRDIIERQKISAWALLDLAARNKETVLGNAYLKAKRQTERGAQSRPAAYVISAMQHDPLTARKLVNKLLIQGIEIQQCTKDFTASTGMSYPAGSFIIPLAQPKMGLIRYLLGRTLYPDNDWTRSRDGSPIRPYDMATDTMFEFMGIQVDPLDFPVRNDQQKLRESVPYSGKLIPSKTGYSFDGRLNDSFKVLNLLTAKGVKVRRVESAIQALRPGDFLVGVGSEAILTDIIKQTGMEFRPLKEEIVQQVHDVRPSRIGMYQRYKGGNIDEGWTRLLLEHFFFTYTSIKDAEIKQGDLHKLFEVILLPDDSTAEITGDKADWKDRPGGERGGRSGRYEETYPPEYRSGIGKEGVESLKTFVKQGGTLVTLGMASEFAIEKFDLDIRNAVVNKSPKEFWCPGSTLKAKFEITHPLAYGMPPEGLALYLNGNPAFDITPSDFNERYEVIVRYAERDLLQSGWLIGEENLAKKAAMISAKFGEGRVILIGFRVQHRAQTHGTFKLLFNALIR